MLEENRLSQKRYLPSLTVVEGLPHKSDAGHAVGPLRAANVVRFRPAADAVQEVT